MAAKAAIGLKGLIFVFAYPREQTSPFVNEQRSETKCKLLSGHKLPLISE